MYKFEHDDLRFSKGGLDELIALDRYAVNATDPKDLAVGDTVVFIADEALGTRKVGVISSSNYVDSKDRIVSPRVSVVGRDGVSHLVDIEHVVRPIETEPADMWARWASGAALVEWKRLIDGGADEEIADSEQAKYKNEFRWLFDGYRYSPGGRIQLGLGHEYLGKTKANVTLVNCFVLEGPTKEATPVAQWASVLRTLRMQIEIQRRGGGTGVNITNIATVRGVGDTPKIALSLPSSHKDFAEIDGLKRMGKFDGVDVTEPIEPNGQHVILVPDSIEGIMSALFEMVAKVYEGNDVIVSFGALRPRHAPVSTIGRSSGAASWMTLFALAARLLSQETIDAVDFAELFAFTTNLVEQGGSRRGALMLVYNVDGPVIEKFVTRKREAGRLVGANVSVAVTDEFMDGLRRSWLGFDEDFEKGRKPHPKYEQAQHIWRLIVESAHASAEPGVLFIDRYNEESNSWYYAKIEATNPCGEQGLPPNGACNLGHLVLPRYVRGDWTTTYTRSHRDRQTNAEVVYDELERATRLAVRFQDDVIDYSTYPTPETKAQQLLERRVGIGTMGLGTMLIMLGLRYGSEQALEFINDLYMKIAYWAYDESMNIAAEKGAFPAFEYGKYVQSGFMKRLLSTFPQLDEKLRKNGIRNVTLLTQAPTGTTGTMIDNLPGFNVSTGIEPYFSLKPYFRASRLGESIPQEPKIIEEYRKANSLGPDDPLPDYFVDTSDLAPEDHVRVQAEVQRWVDSAIAKTINAPADATVDDVAEAYMLAFELGVKGCTVYVDGSRQAQVLSTERDKAKLESHLEAGDAETQNDGDRYIEDLEEIEEVAEGLMPDPDWRTDAPAPKPFIKRPTRVYGYTERINVPVGDSMTKVYVTINVKDEPFEVFVNANDPSIADAANALGRMVTQMLRYGGTSDNVAQVVKHLRRGQSNMMSLPSQMARLIEEVAYKGVEFPTASNSEYADHAKAVDEAQEAPKRTGRKLAVCPECGEEAYDKVNCVCHSCGASKCS